MPYELKTAVHLTTIHKHGNLHFDTTPLYFILIPGDLREDGQSRVIVDRVIQPQRNVQSADLFEIRWGEIK